MPFPNIPLPSVDPKTALALSLSLLIVGGWVMYSCETEKRCNDRVEAEKRLCDERIGTKDEKITELKKIIEGKEQIIKDLEKKYITCRNGPNQCVKKLDDCSKDCNRQLSEQQLHCERKTKSSTAELKSRVATLEKAKKCGKVMKPDRINKHRAEQEEAETSSIGVPQ